MTPNSQVKNPQVYIDDTNLKISINFINKKSKTWNLEYKVLYLIKISILLCIQWSNLKISIGFFLFHQQKHLEFRYEKKILSAKRSILVYQPLKGSVNT